MQMIETDKIMPLMRLLLLFEPNADERLALMKPVIDMHSIEAVPVKHGRWIETVDENGHLCNAWRTCSVCGGKNWSKKPNYCPNCGADMKGENNEC